MTDLVNYEGVETAGTRDGYKLVPNSLQMSAEATDEHIARLQRQVVDLLKAALPKLNMLTQLGGKVPNVPDHDRFARDLFAAVKADQSVAQSQEKPE